MEIDKVKELWFADATPASVAELAEYAAAALGDGDVEGAALAKSGEARHARFLNKQQHAVVVGAELIELWPELRRRPIPDDDPYDLRERLVWGMKYVAGSAMDIPEIPLATTDDVLATLGEMLDRYKLQQPALWQLQARRAFIAGDVDVLRSLIAKVGPTATRYHHVFQCGDCPGCVFTQFASWLGPDADVADVEDVLAPVIGTRPFPPDPEPWVRVLDLMYDKAGACKHSVKTTPIYLSRAYVRAGRLAEALREAKRAVQLTEGEDAGLPERALVARTAVATAMGDTDDARRFATDVVERTRHLEDIYERLDAIVVAHAALRDAALAADAVAMAERLDARIVNKRHVAATRAALAATT